MTERVVVYVDIVGSVEDQSERGDVTARLDHSQRLEEIRASLAIADPGLKQISAIAGDGMTLVGGGENAVKAFHNLVMQQAGHAAWPVPPAFARMAIGRGEIEEAYDEKTGFTSFHGSCMGLTARVLAMCPPGSVVVTESASVAIKAAGFSERLTRKEAKFKGIKDIGTYYVYTPPSRASCNGLWQRVALMALASTVLLAAIAAWIAYQ